jgi:pimeloyl-ACP methyl ester carboxylesterase
MVGVRETILAVQLRARDYRLATWFRESGDELVLFLHGLGCSKENWRQAWGVRELRDNSFLAVDFLGFGHSPRPAQFGYRLEDQAAVLAAVIDAHALKRIHLVAHSMGGTIALLLPARILSRLGSLILVEPRLVNSSCGIAAEAVKYTYEEFTSGACMLDRFEAAPCRKVFIYGAENRHLEELAEIPSDLKIEIGHSGHFVMRDNPDDFYRQLAAFIAAAQ